MRTAVLLLAPLFILVLVACSTPEPTPDIPATVEAEIAKAQSRIDSSPTVTPPATARVEPASLQDFTPTPAPPFEPGTGARVIAISQLQDEAFWQSEESFWLVGCHIPIWVKKETLRSSLKPFSNSGTFDQPDSVAMVEGGWTSEMARTLRDDSSLKCLAMRVRYARSDRYCFNLSPVFSDCAQKDEVTIPEFKAAGSLKDWAQLVSTNTVRAYADAPTPTPMPTATAEPLPTNTPIPEVAEAQRQLVADAKLNDAFSGQGYKMRPPVGWDTNKAVGEVPAHFLNPTPDLQGGVIPFHANINIVIEPVPEMTMQEYVDATKRLISLELPDHNFIDDAESTVNGHSAHFLESTFQHEIFNLRNRQLLLLSDDQAFVVTTTALEETWESYDDIFDASLRSFELAQRGP